MGYTLKIGEAIMDYTEDHVGISCEVVTLPDAPAFGEPTDHSSQRWPSYTAWLDAMRALDMMDVMYSDRNGGVGWFERNSKTRYPLLAIHPGASPITIEHVEYVEEKLAAYRAKHPDHRAEFPPLKPGITPEVLMFPSDDELISDPRYDGNLCRGVWLAWWLRWAVENCKRPVFVNS